MIIFGKHVSPISSFSKLNILRVENYENIFYETYEISFLGENFICEKTGSFGDVPVVSIPIEIGGEKTEYPFLIERGESNIIFHPDNIQIPVEKSLEDEKKIIYEEKDSDREGLLIEMENKENDFALLQEKEKEKKIKEIELFENKKREEIEKSINDVRDSLYSEFSDVVLDLRESFQSEKQNLQDETKERINEEIKSLESNFEHTLSRTVNRFHDLFKKKRDEDIQSLQSTVINLGESFQEHHENIDGELKELEKHLNEKINNIKDTLTEEYLKIEDSNENNIKDIVFNLSENYTNDIKDIFNNIDELYSFFENNEKVLEKTREKQEQHLNEKLSEYDEVIKKKEDQFQEILKNTEYLQNEVSYVKKQFREKSLLMEKTKEEKDFDKRIKNLEDSLNEEMRRMKRHITVFGGGGGTVAKQFADGGNMGGDLTVTGNISATGGVYGSGLTPFSAATYYPSATASGYFTTLFIEGSSFALPLFQV